MQAHSASHPFVCCCVVPCAACCCVVAASLMCVRPKVCPAVPVTCSPAAQLGLTAGTAVIEKYPRQAQHCCKQTCFVLLCCCRTPYNRKCAFDAGDYGLGFAANSLQLGCDCLGDVTYFDGGEAPQHTLSVYDGHAGLTTACAHALEDCASATLVEPDQTVRVTACVLLVQSSTALLERRW